MSSGVRDFQFESGQHPPVLPGWELLSANSSPLFETDPLVGQTVDGKYRLNCIIGTGSWSRVYRARELSTGRFVALKILHAMLISNKEVMARFQREAESGERLNHPNICSVYGSGCLTTGQPYIAMEYVDGETLSSILRRKTHLPFDEALPIFTACCDALQHAHAENIIHRDIKPGNIIVSNNHQIKLLDFGLAKFICDGEQDLTQAGTALGTVKYLSPEQAMGETVDARSDIYSLAAVLYETMSGTCVFEGGSAFAVIDQHVHGFPRKFKECRSAPFVPAGIESIVLKGLSKQRLQRFQSVQEFKQALQLEALRLENSGSRARFRRGVILAMAMAMLVFSFFYAAALR